MTVSMLHEFMYKKIMMKTVIQADVNVIYVNKISKIRMIQRYCSNLECSTVRLK